MKPECLVNPECRLRDLGRIAYAEFASIQAELVERRLAGDIGDTMLLAEHDPVLTSGRDGGEDQVLADPETLRRAGLTVVATDRGGSITYHGPGQLMIYPLLDLGGFGSDIHLHVRRLEEVLIRTLAGWGIVAERRPGYPGVWVGEAKIAAVGIGVRKWITSHGAALNLAPDLTHFEFINPCGLRGAAVTSVLGQFGEAGAGRTDLPSAADLRARAVREVARHFAEVYGVTLVPWSTN